MCVSLSILYYINTSNSLGKTKTLESTIQGYSFHMRHIKCPCSPAELILTLIYKKPVNETILKYSLTDPTSERNFSSTFRTIKVADFRYLSKAEVGFNFKSPG